MAGNRARLMLGFVHGWGFDASLWDGIRAELGAQNISTTNLGYFQDANALTNDGGPMIAIGHSLGCLKLLNDLPANCVGLVAINGFDRFAGDAGDQTAVPRRVVERMLARFREEPELVLADFRKRCGSDAPLPGAIRAAALLADLELLRDADERPVAAGLNCPVLVLQGDEDAILPPAMRDAVFAGSAQVERIDLPGHGHLLPMTAASWCAGQIRHFAGRLSVMV